MADFDNGLPPEGVDATASNVNSVLFEKQEVADSNAYNVSSVILEKKDVVDSPLSQVSGILLDKIETERRNRSMFL